MTQALEMTVGIDGWITGVAHIASPNYDIRPADSVIRLIVVHAISLPPGVYGGAYVAELFTNQLDGKAHPYFAAIAGRRVSAHFFIRRDGSVIQFVSCQDRAWHAGASCWRGQECCNDNSIGIELEGDDATRFTSQQYESLRGLLHLLRGHFPIDEVVGHADISPGRKTDPGPYFVWHEITPAVLLDALT